MEESEMHKLAMRMKKRKQRASQHNTSPLLPHLTRVQVRQYLALCASLSELDPDAQLNLILTNAQHVCVFALQYVTNEHARRHERDTAR
jgi:hypothetical protein